MKTSTLHYLVSILILVSNITFTNTSGAQEWRTMMTGRNPNVHEIKKSFYKWWDDSGSKTGRSMWKLFHRWLYKWEPRSGPSGYLPSPQLIYEAMQKHKQNLQGGYDGSNWIPLGPYNWTSISYSPGLGRVNTIAIDPFNSNIFYAGTPGGGLWKSINGGNNWFTTTDDLPVLGISTIAIDPSNSNNIFIGTGDADGYDTYSIGVLKSTDGGNTFNPTSLTFSIVQYEEVAKILIDPVSPSTLYSATTAGIYKSTDAGNNWNDINANGGYFDIEFQPGNSNVIYAARNQNSGGAFVRSTDAGNTFTDITNGLPDSGSIARIAIGVSPADPDYVYVLAGNNWNGMFYGLYRSTNSGISFVQMSDSPNILGYNSDGSDSVGNPSYTLTIAVSPNNINEIFTGGVNIWESTNGGATLTANSYWYYPPAPPLNFTHADIHHLEFVNNVFYCGTDGGFFISSNSGNTWIDKSAGMQITQIYNIGDIQANPYLFYLGTQDNGSNRLRLNEYVEVFGGDGGFCEINYIDTSIVYAESENGYFLKSTDGGNSFNPSTQGIPATDTGGFVTPFVMSPSNPDVLYIGYHHIYKTTNGANSWTRVSDFSSFDQPAVDLAISESDTAVVYACYPWGMFKTTNGGSNWTNITSGLPTSLASLSGIAISGSESDDVWVTISYYAQGHKVYYSSNGGSSWTNYSGSSIAPNVPVNCAVHRNNSNDGVYIGTDVGVYYRDATMSDWEPFSLGLPNVVVNDLEINYKVQKIRAATFGRGLWESQLDTTVGINPISSNLPQKFQLYQNYPNPFNPNTTILYDIVNKAHVKISIFDITGKLVRTLVNEVQATGERAIVWDGKGNDGEVLSSGIYFYELTVSDFKETKKMMMIR